jgi:hypothetical protein
MQIGMCDRPEDDSPALKMFVTFAKLVAEKEREACAKVCEKEKDIDGISTAKAFAEIIRARGKE